MNRYQVIGVLLFCFVIGCGYAKFQDQHKLHAKQAFETQQDDDGYEDWLNEKEEALESNEIDYNEPDSTGLYEQVRDS